jgi:hypothetical protein
MYRFLPRLTWQRWIDAMMATTSFSVAAFYPFHPVWDEARWSWLAGGGISMGFLAFNLTARLNAHMRRFTAILLLRRMLRS